MENTMFTTEVPFGSLERLARIASLVSKTRAPYFDPSDASLKTGATGWTVEGTAPRQWAVCWHGEDSEVYKTVVGADSADDVADMVRDFGSFLEALPVRNAGGMA